jgi:Mannosyl-glycoprotein endo-beta-N-acetylglucosaminidase
MASLKVNGPVMVLVYEALCKRIGKGQAAWAIGQALNESASFNSRRSVEALNFWGIHADPLWRGAIWRGRDMEFTKGTAHRVEQGWRAYPTIQASVDDYLGLIERNYGNTLKQPSLNLFLDTIAQNWSGNLNYWKTTQSAVRRAQGLINAMEQLQLPIDRGVPVSNSEEK